MRITFLMPVILVVGLCACDSNRVYEQNRDFNTKHWAVDSVAEFKFEADKDQVYNVYINLRNSIEYGFYNIYMQYSLEDTLGNVIQSDLVDYNLFEPKTGKPYGQGLGDIFSHQLPLMENYTFEKTGGYLIKLQQFMRKEELEGILSVGIRLEKAEDEG